MQSFGLIKKMSLFSRSFLQLFYCFVSEEQEKQKMVNLAFPGGCCCLSFYFPPISFNLSHPVAEEVYTPEFNVDK